MPAGSGLASASDIDQRDARTCPRDGPRWFSEARTPPMISGLPGLSRDEIALRPANGRSS